MKRLILCLFTMAIFAASLVCNSTPLFAQGNGHGNGNGNGKGGGHNPPIVLPIQYRIHNLAIPQGTPPDTALEVRDLSNTLLVVGQLTHADNSRIAYFYDHDLGVASTLKDLISPADWNWLIESGYTDSTLIGVNDSGLVVGLVENADASQRKGIIVDTQTLTLHDADFPVDYFWARKVNNTGDIAGVYRHATGEWRTYIYNPGMINPGEQFLPRDLGPLGWQWMRVTDSRLMFVGDDDEDEPQGVRYVIATDQIEFVPGRARDMDESGNFGGRVEIRVKRNKVNHFPAIWNDVGILWQGDLKNGLVQILNSPRPGNITGDALIRITGTTRGGLYLHHPDPDHPEWELIDLAQAEYVDEYGETVVFDELPPNAIDMTEDNGTDFGAWIAGNILFVPEDKMP